jgi:DNA adenine methylase
MLGFIPWVGGKSRLAPVIISLFPRHDCYIEVFGGGAWVLLYKPKVKTEIYNDVDGDLVNLFRVARDYDLQFINRQYFLLSSRQEYKTFQEAWRNNKPKDDIDRAIMYYYLLKNSFGAKITAGWGFGRHDTPRYPTCLDTLMDIRERLKETYIENNPFNKCIETWDSNEAMFYLDPPYMGTEFYYKGQAGKFGEGAREPEGRAGRHQGQVRAQL